MNPIIQPYGMLFAFEEAEKQQEPEIPPTLVRREVGVITAFAHGLGNRQIATDLSINENTVRNHVSGIYEKPRVYDR